MRLSEDCLAGVPKFFHIPGQFFCFDSVPAGSVDAVFYRDGRKLYEELLGVGGGWAVAPGGGFDAVEVTSSVSQLVSFYITRGPIRSSVVSGTISVLNFPAVQPVSGPLTDAELRATPVPVSMPGGGGLTDAELRATPVPVSGPLTDAQLRAAAVPVSGPLTDAQLRAAAVPVSGPLTDAQLRAADVPTRERAATLNINVTGGANAAATATLPAAGAGLFHYITHIFIKRVATAALAGGAILSVTTTNLTGRVWRTGNQMSITVSTQEGTVLRDQEFAHPIRSDVANTASTIVCPAPGAAVSWHLSIDYFTAP